MEVDARGHVEDVVARLADHAAHAHVVLAAGVSLGAHAVALWAARGGRADSLVLAMPAWTGPAGPVAGLTAATAAEVRARGSAAVLAGLRAAAAGDWVVDELARGWAEYDDDALAAALEAAAASPGPTLDELGGVDVPAAVVALADDPLHPAEVAAAWAAALPHAALTVVARGAPGPDRGALGRAARAALGRLSASR